MYKPTPGFTFKSNPQKVGERLEKLRNKHGRLDKFIVVEDAKNPKSPYHKEFEWDNEIAGQKWRWHTADNLIRVVCVRDMDLGQEEYIPVYVSVRNDVGRHYETIENVVGDDELFEKVKEDLQREIDRLEAKFSKYERFAAFFAQVQLEFGKLS